nr:DUF6673 family protein [uncultured Faecalimonas sp.]
MKINNVILDFDLYDADNVELRKKYFEKLDEMKTVAEDIPYGTETEKHRYLCGRVKTIFDEVFGEGTGVKVCGMKDNLLVCMKAFDELVSEQARQDREYRKVMRSIAEKGKTAGKNRNKSRRNTR